MITFLLYTFSTDSSDFSQHHALLYLTIQSYLVAIFYQLLSVIVVIMLKSHHKQRNDTRNTMMSSMTSPSRDLYPTISNPTTPRDVEIGSVSYNVSYNMVNIPTVSVAMQTDARKNKQRPNLPWYLKLRWFLFNVTAVMSVTVTVCYYGFLYHYTHTLVSGDSLFTDLNFHAFTSAFILLDIAISAIPLRILHVIHGGMVLLLYVVLTLIYWSLDKENNIIYPVLNWNDPTFSLIFTGLGIVGTILVWSILFGLYKLRIWFAEKCA